MAQESATDHNLDIALKKLDKSLLSYIANGTAQHAMWLIQTAKSAGLKGLEVMKYFEQDEQRLEDTK